MFVFGSGGWRLLLYLTLLANFYQGKVITGNSKNSDACDNHAGGNPCCRVH